MAPAPDAGTFPLASYQAQTHLGDAQGSSFADLISTGSLPAGSCAPACSSSSTIRNLASTSAPSPSLILPRAPPGGGGHPKTVQAQAQAGPGRTYHTAHVATAPTTSHTAAPQAGPSTAMTATARAAVESTSALQVTSASNSSPTGGPAAHGSAFWAMTRQLQTRLQYARLKVEHGWQKQNLNEVENLYFRQIQRGQRELRERTSTSAKERERASITSLSEKEPQKERGEKDGGRNRTNESANVIGMKGSTPVDTHANAMNGNAMDVDLGPAPSESPNDPPPPNEPANAASISSSAVSLYTGPGPTPSASSSDPSVATPPTQSANTHSSSAQNPSAPSTSTASPALTYDSFWSSVSSVSTSTQRPNLAALTTHVAGKNTSSGTVAGYQSYQNLQSFQALQAFRAALSGNGVGEGTAGLQAGQTESQKAGAAAHVDENSSSATPEGAGTAQH